MRERVERARTRHLWREPDGERGVVHDDFGQDLEVTARLLVTGVGEPVDRRLLTARVGRRHREDRQVVGQGNRLGQSRRRSAAEAHNGVCLRVGDRGARPFGELERHVLHDLVPLAHDERAEIFSKRVTELLGLRVDDEEDPRGTQARRARRRRG